MNYDIDLITKYINEELNESLLYGNTIKKIKKLNMFNINPDIIIYLFDNNDIFYHAIEKIVATNYNLIISNELDQIFKDNIVLTAVSLYCEKNGI